MGAVGNRDGENCSPKNRMRAGPRESWVVATDLAEGAFGLPPGTPFIRRIRFVGPLVLERRAVRGKVRQTGTAGPIWQAFRPRSSRGISAAVGLIPKAWGGKVARGGRGGTGQDSVAKALAAATAAF